MVNAQLGTEFTIKGWLYDHITLTWKNGELMADNAEVLQFIHTQIQLLEETETFIFCPNTRLFFTKNFLQQPLSAYLVLKHLLKRMDEAPDEREFLPMHLHSHTPLFPSRNQS
jgi:hypothetical protein